MLRVLPILALLALFVSGCSTTPNPRLYLSHFSLQEPTVGDFEVCASAGCRKLSRLSYSDEEWRSIINIFTPAPTTPADERDRLMIAIGAMETFIGAKNGTSADNMKNDRRVVTGPQLDCIAEAANTTVALILLDKAGLIRHHRVGDPQHRGFFRGNLPHNTASLYDNETGEHYALDSWFYANGVPPVCVPVSQWKAGYDPHKQ
ncbi:MAG: hypothetical protein ACN4GF_12140 [Lentimonas sp.]